MAAGVRTAGHCVLFVNGLPVASKQVWSGIGSSIADTGIKYGMTKNAKGAAALKMLNETILQTEG